MDDEPTKPLYDVKSIQERVRQKLCQQQRDRQKELFRHWQHGVVDNTGGPNMMTAKQVLRRWFRESIPLDKSTIARITVLSEEVFWILRHRKPHFRPCNSGWEAVYGGEDTAIVLMSAHTILSKEYARTRNEFFGIYAQGLSWAAPGCRCLLCAMDQPLPPGLGEQPVTATVTRPRITLAVPLDDLVAGDRLAIKTAHAAAVGTLEVIEPAGRGKGLWLYLVGDNGHQYRVRSSSLRQLERVHG